MVFKETFGVRLDAECINVDHCAMDQHVADLHHRRKRFQPSALLDSPGRSARLLLASTFAKLPVETSFCEFLELLLVGIAYLISAGMLSMTDELPANLKLRLLHTPPTTNTKCKYKHTNYPKRAGSTVYSATLKMAMASQLANQPTMHFKI